jgi:hypothetical protein
MDVNYFNDVENKPLDTSPTTQNGTVLTNVPAISAGAKDQVFKFDDKEGIWLGGEKFADAPFSVTMNGLMTSSGAVIGGYVEDGGAAADINANVTTINGGKITTNTIEAAAIKTGVLIVGTNVGLGTAQDSSGVTTIVGNTVTTSFVNALNVNAATVSASISISSPTINGGSITIGSSNNVFKADSNGICLGNATWASAPFRVDMSGEVVATNISISKGSGNSIFKADSNGIYLGNATFASAPFRVNMSGAVTASSITITNGSIGAGSSYTGNSIDSAYIGNLSASKITTDTLSAARISGGILAGSFIINSSAYFNFEYSSATAGYMNVTGLDDFQFSGVNLSVNGNKLKGDNGDIDFGQSGRIQFSNHVDPPDGGSKNFGGSDRYWNEVHCKSVVDHSLVWLDGGVDLLDGRHVSDVEALKEMKPSTTLSPLGVPYIDKSTTPVGIYHPAKIADKDVYDLGEVDEKSRGKNNDPYFKERKKILRYKKGEKVGGDGTNSTVMLSLVIGAVKELAKRLEILEQKK